MIEQTVEELTPLIGTRPACWFGSLSTKRIPARELASPRVETTNRSGRYSRPTAAPSERSFWRSARSSAALS